MERSSANRAYQWVHQESRCREKKVGMSPPTRSQEEPTTKPQKNDQLMSTRPERVSQKPKEESGSSLWLAAWEAWRYHSPNSKILKEDHTCKNNQPSFKYVGVYHHQQWRSKRRVNCNLKSPVWLLILCLLCDISMSFNFSKPQSPFL